MVVPIVDTNHTEQSNGRMVVPSAPPLENGRTQTVNYGDDGAYVNFLITHNNNSDIVIAERHAIIESNSELTKMITGNCNARKVDGNFVIGGVDKDEFELLVR